MYPIFHDFKKIKILIFWVAIIFFSEPNNLHAGYVKKIFVEEFSNHLNWTGQGNPGKLISEMLKKELQNQGNLLLIQNKKNHSSDMPPHQFLIRGEILKFKSKRRSEINDQIIPDRKQPAEVDLNISIIHSITQRILKSKTIKIVSSVGKIPFKLKENQTQLDIKMISRSAMGNVLKNLIFKTSLFITDALTDTPFEAILISVNTDSPYKIDQNINSKINKESAIRKTEMDEIEMVLINAGKNHGIEFRDRFHVYSIKPGYIDPITQNSLGEKITRIGVIRVFTVQESYSLALVEAGKGFEPKQIIRPYKKEPTVQNVNPWWAFLPNRK